MPVEYKPSDPRLRGQVLTDPEFRYNAIANGLVKRTTANSWIKQDKERSQRVSQPPTSTADLIAQAIHEPCRFMLQKRVDAVNLAVHGLIEAEAACPTKIAAAAIRLDAKETTSHLAQLHKLLGNSDVFTEDLFTRWFTDAIKGFDRINLNIDWSDFHNDDQTSLVAGIQLDNKACLPVLFKTVRKSRLKNKMNAIILAFLRRIKQMLGVFQGQVVMVADRGFGNGNFMAMCGEVGLLYLVRGNKKYRIEEPAANIGAIGLSDSKRQRVEPNVQSVEANNVEMNSKGQVPTEHRSHDERRSSKKTALDSKLVRKSNRLAGKNAAKARTLSTISNAQRRANAKQRPRKSGREPNKVAGKTALNTGQWLLRGEKTYTRNERGEQVLHTTTKVIHNARVTKDRYLVPTVVMYYEKDMKGSWTLFTNVPNITAREVLTIYSARWSIERFFKHGKDRETGLGFLLVHFYATNACDRRDNLWLLIAMATRIWIAIGKASQLTGTDKAVDSRCRTDGQKEQPVAGATKSKKRPALSIYRLGREIRKYWDSPSTGRKKGDKRRAERRAAILLMCCTVLNVFADHLRLSGDRAALFPR